MASRSLTLVAMCLQKLANLIEFGQKVLYTLNNIYMGLIFRTGTDQPLIDRGMLGIDQFPC